MPTLTITAPGPHDVALVAGTDYVWTKDGQTFTTAPTDAGEYTVSLTSKGIGKIKAANAANLDWSNVTINENASYTISKAQATILLVKLLNMVRMHLMQITSNQLFQQIIR